MDTIERILKAIHAHEQVKKVYAIREWYLFKMVKDIKRAHANDAKKSPKKEKKVEEKKQDHISQQQHIHEEDAMDIEME